MMARNTTSVNTMLAGAYSEKRGRIEIMLKQCDRSDWAAITFPRVPVPAATGAAFHRQYQYLDSV